MKSAPHASGFGWTQVNHSALQRFWMLAEHQGLEKAELALNLAIHTDIVESTLETGADAVSAILEFTANAFDCLP